MLILGYDERDEVASKDNVKQSDLFAKLSNYRILSWSEHARNGLVQYHE